MEIPEIFWRLIKDRLVTKIESYEVVSVNKDKDTCTCKPFDEGPELLNVRLTSTIEAKDTKIVAYPAVGSVVLVTIINNVKTDGFIIGLSEVDEVQWNCEKIVINGGELGGMAKAKEIKLQYDITKELLDAMLTVFNGAPIPEPGNGSPSALQTAIQGAIAGKTTGSFEDIENEKFKH